MACFTVPAGEAIVSTIVKKVLKKRIKVAKRLQKQQVFHFLVS